MSEKQTFEKALVKSLLTKRLEEKQVSKDDTLKVAGELLRIFVVEALHRSTKVAEKSIEPGELGCDDIIVEPEHLEKVVVQLLLDF
mmetsp:Transcript_7261/g.8800  ORF Transcript_7261/g.8800 Transcript_7261/m.8800 type:complete len:86 (+) Transcript_7261:81-338(+)